MGFRFNVKLKLIENKKKSILMCQINAFKKRKYRKNTIKQNINQLPIHLQKKKTYLIRKKSQQ